MNAMQRLAIQDATPLRLRQMRNETPDGTDLAIAIDQELAGWATTAIIDNEEEW
jgi:hypothetical protein